MVAGKLRKADGQVLDVDMAALRRDQAASAERLFAAYPIEV